MIRGLLTIILAIISVHAGSSNLLADGRELALELKDNVVLVRCGKEAGFGFIVSQEFGDAFIVTADHVVQDCRSTPNSDQGDITVRFHRNRHDFFAKLMPEKSHDLAVLRVRIPSGHSWRDKVMAFPEDLKHGAEVWYVGRTGAWEVPSSPGSYYGNEESHVFVDMNVKVGTSGAPLITSSGIVGMMLVRQKADRARALKIEFIKDKLQEWKYPWALSPNWDMQPIMVRAKKLEYLGVYDQAFRLAEQAARRGNPRAMILLGGLYLNGEGVSQDYLKARQLYLKAVELGEAEAMLALGAIYHSGMGVPKDTTLARNWYCKAAKAGVKGADRIVKNAGMKCQ